MAPLALSLVLLKAPFPIEVTGNWVLVDEVYLAVLELPPEAEPTLETAEKVRTSLTDFLHRSGYELAAVQVESNEGGLTVRVDEGQLDKVVFRGKLTLQQLRFKLALSLPHDVFNRPHLEREIRELSEALGIPPPRFELVPTRRVAHLGPQLENLGTIKGFALVRPQQKYELHVVFHEDEWNIGAGLDVRASYFDGLEVGLNYQGTSLLLGDDRWRVAASGGLGLRGRTRDDVLYPAPSRVYAELLWFSPAFADRLARPFVWVRAEGLARQRKDLLLENYYNVSADVSLNLKYRLTPAFAVSVGGGMQDRLLFGFRPAANASLPPSLGDIERVRTFALLRAELVFDSGEGRWDRRHDLVLEGRHFFGVNDPHHGEGRLWYQKVIALGWHDLWLKARGTWLWREVIFHDEEPIAGLHLRGVFGDLYVRRAASATAEMRFSLTRDMYKLGLYADVAAFGEIDRAANLEQLGYGISFGPGFHALIEGMFQLDLYAAFGFLSDRRFDSGVTLLLLKVF